MNALAHTSTPTGSRLDNRRMLAALIDLALVGAGGAAILAAAGVLGGDGAPVGAPLAGVVLSWALYYYFACESGGGQTLGKKLMRVRVVREDGGAAGMREVGVRTLLRVVDTALVGLIAMLATGERRARLGDLAAGTIIVSADGTGAAAPGAPPAVTVEHDAEGPGQDVDRDPGAFGEGADEELASWDEGVDSGSAAPYQPITRFDPGGHEPDIASPSLKELAQDIAATAGSAPDEAEAEPVAQGEPVVEDETVVGAEPGVEAEPVVEAEAEPVAQGEPVVEVESVVEVEREPLVEVDVGGPEIDADGPDLTVRSVETVSAIDLVMGADEPTEDRPAVDEPPAGA
jgi:uncharacterized RDD family membrane protein YckC